MYRINTIPGKAAAIKGYASFPEDFPNLRPGEDFSARKVGADWEIETTLGGEALEKRLQIFKQEAQAHGD